MMQKNHTITLAHENTHNVQNVLKNYQIDSNIFSRRQHVIMLRHVLF